MEPTPNSYDELPYPSVPIPETSPVRISLASFLRGGPQPPVEGFRAIELGCGNGRNLLPLGYYHSGAEILGVDNSAAAIARANAGADEIGAKNVRFEVADLTRPGALLERTFDYVILHGVFSWVDEEARAGILELCARTLAPDGLVYLSHNVQSGWRVRSLVREVLKHAVEDIHPYRERVRRAKEIATRLAGTLEGTDHAQQIQLQFELDRVSTLDDSYFFHEYLLPVNQPFHHREVVAMMRERGLEYVTDARRREAAGREPEAIRRALDAMQVEGDRREEFADFLGCRTFRSSIYARAEAVGAADPDRALDAVAGMFVVGNLLPETVQASIAEETEEEYVNAQGSRVTVTGPLLKATLVLLAAEWPRPVPIGELILGARDRLARVIGEDRTTEADAREIRRDLVTLQGEGMVEIFPVAPRAVGGAKGGRPHALARYEVELGDHLTTPFHTALRLSEEDRTRVRALAAGEETEGDEAAADCHETLSTWGLTEPTG